MGKDLEGRYRIEYLLGSGAMGSVYCGTQLSVGRKVAVKVLNRALKSDREVRDRFRTEAQAVAALNHPNSVTLHDFGFSDELDAHFMVIEFIDGHSLADLISQGLDEREATLIGCQIAEVLDAAHQAGILHRDLKPENVMVVRASQGTPFVKVLDFGLARIFGDTDGEGRITRQGQLFGTPVYMSPEQCSGTLDVGPAADIYALGITLYEMIEGRPPFMSSKVPEVLIMQLKNTPPPFSTTPQPEIADLVLRMLSKEAEDRPTASEVADVLRPYANPNYEFPLVDTVEEPPPAPAERVDFDEAPPNETAHPDLSAETQTDIGGFGPGVKVAAAVVAIGIVAAGIASFVYAPPVEVPAGTPAAAVDTVKAVEVEPRPTLAEPTSRLVPATPDAGRSAAEPDAGLALAAGEDVGTVAEPRPATPEEPPEPSEAPAAESPSVTPNEKTDIKKKKQQKSKQKKQREIRSLDFTY